MSFKQQVTSIFYNLLDLRARMRIIQTPCYIGGGRSYGLDTLLEKQASFPTILPKVYYSQRL